MGTVVTKRADQLKPGDEITWPHSGRRAEVVEAGRKPGYDGIWLRWSDGIGPFIADDALEFTLAPSLVRRDEHHL